MKFISYKEWKQLNESMGHTTPLSIRKPTTIGELQSRWTEMGMLPMKSKKMPMGMDDMGGDEELPKKKKKKGPPMPPMGGDEDLGGLGGEEEEDLDADLGDEEEDLGDLEGDEEDLEGDEDLGDEDAEADDEEDIGGDLEDLGDDEADLDADMDGDEEGMPMPPPMPPKKKGKSMAGAAMMLKGASHMVKGMKESAGCGPDCTCKKCKKAKAKVTKEDQDFINSLKDQCGTNFFDINNDGTFKEDAIFTPYDPNAELAGDTDENEPKPGEVGFAPQQKLGSELGSMAEWTKKYRRKIHEAIGAKEVPAKKKGKAKAKARKSK